MTEKAAEAPGACANTEKPPLIVLTGPTAVGKTALSIRLAKAVNGEIVSADSMQVYRGLDIGSAKITPEEMDGVPHHLIDILDPQEDFNVAEFKRLAEAAVREITGRGRIPIIAGGTGFYIQALLYDVDFEETQDDGNIRKELEQLAQEAGAKAPERLHAILEKFDPQAAKEIHKNNVKRVIRAIEYFRQTGERISAHNEAMRARTSPYRFRYYVLNRERSLLYERIDRRVDLMMEQGLLEEVRRLQSLGCHRGQTAMQGLGYKELLDYLGGGTTLEEAVAILKRDTRHFAKRQLTWFKRERDVTWLNLPEFGNDEDRVLAWILEDCKNAGLLS